MDIGKLKAEIKREYFQTKMGILEWTYHIEPMYGTMIKLITLYDLKREILLPAVLLHDIAAIEEGYVEHSKKSAEKAKEILENFKADEEQIKEITKIIRNHHNYDEDLGTNDIALKTADAYVMISDREYFIFRVIALTRKNEIPVEDLYPIIKRDFIRMKNYLYRSPFRSALI